MKYWLRIVLVAVMIVPTMLCRAQDVKAIADSMKRQYAPDNSTAVWEVTAKRVGGAWTLKGKMDDAGNKEALLAELERQGVKYNDEIEVLDAGWAMVKLSVASMRTQGRHAAELATQAIMGTPVRLLERAGEWYRAQTPDDYIAYIPSSSIVKKSEAQLRAWRKAQRVIVTAMQSQMVADSSDGAEVVSDLVLGNILEYRGEAGKWIKVATPDGRTGYVSRTDVADFDEWSQQAFDADLIISTAWAMLGGGYLWGGTSTKLTDCSGMTKVCYFANAIILQRDASQQALTGTRIAADSWRSKAQKGDLLFWGTRSGRVTHVGLYIADGKYIHCSGMVKYNSLDPQDASYLSTPFLSISRIEGKVGSRGIVAVKNHPWYFGN